MSKYYHVSSVKSKVQAGEADYELHSLGWKAFQNLCSTITSDIWGQTVQAFHDSHDGGRDGAFSGTWTPKPGEESFLGSFTVQCKFISKSDRSIRRSHLDDEIEKATRLAEKDLANNYFLFTNASLSGAADEEIRTVFESIPGINRFVAYGRERISQFIRESSRLRMLVPRVYGLGDLSQILDERAYGQAREILSSLGSDLSKFVITDAYSRSAKAILEHGFVLLLGEPACGKSTIAASLALGALDEWECSTIKVRDADDFVKHSNPNESKQLFWVDDAFGTTQLDLPCIEQWNRTFPHMTAAIQRGARVIFTSRDYIYRSAREFLKESALPIIKASQVVIEVERLSKEEREQILYNHVKLGKQDQQFKSQIKPFLPEAAAHERFTPEVARRLGDPLFTKSLYLSKETIDNFINNPGELLNEIIRTLDAGSRSALALIFMRGGTLSSPIKMTDGEEKSIANLGGSIVEVRKSLNALKGSLVNQTVEGNSHFWRFKHPTIRDAFASIISDDNELMDIYLTGAPMKRIFGEVSCGNVDIQGIKVILPTERYKALIDRIQSFDITKWENKNSLSWFLAHRCDQEFIEFFLASHSNFIANLTISTYSYSSEMNFMIRLRQLGLLPEEKRIEIVSRFRNHSTQNLDDGFLSERFQILFTDVEKSGIIDTIRTSLLPKLNSHIEDARLGYDKDEEPEVWFSEMTRVLHKYRFLFKENEIALTQIDTALEDIENTVEELKAEHKKPESDDTYENPSDENEPDESRSIFDDVDV